MELIRKTGKKFMYGRNYQCGIFICPLCKNEIEIPITAGKIQKTCSCFQHGGKKTRLYSIWKSMRNRCFYKNDDSYKNYGAKGVIVCEKWNNSFVDFRDWSFENKYNDDLQIDRINPDGDYCPENCRWVTPADNSRARKTTKLSIEKANEIRMLYKNGDFSQMELAKKYGTFQNTIWLIIHNRLWKNNCSVLNPNGE